MSGKMTKQFTTAIIDKLKNIGIPDWVKYIAADRNGQVYGYRLKPEIDDKRGDWSVVESQDTPDIIFLLEIDFDSTNWKKTLIHLIICQQIDDIEIVEGFVNNTPKVAMLITIKLKNHLMEMKRNYHGVIPISVKDSYDLSFGKLEIKA